MNDLIDKLAYLSSPDAERMSDYQRINEFVSAGFDAVKEIERLQLDIVFCREAMRHADIDLSMILPEVANLEMQRSIRKTLERLDEAKARSLASPAITSRDSQ